MTRSNRHILFFTPFFLGILLLSLDVSFAQQPYGSAIPGHPEEAKDMRLVGFHDLQGRSAYQPVILQQGDRWIAYIGLQPGSSINPLSGITEGNGSLVVDVTDPKSPRLLSHIPADRINPEKVFERGAQMVQACSIGDRTYMLRAISAVITEVNTSRHEVWDVTDPFEPVFVKTIVNGLQDTHKSWWECDSGIAYLVGAKPGWRVPRMAKIYDLSDPANPRFIRDFALPGQEPGAQVQPVPGGHVNSAGLPGGGLHGPIVLDDRVYFANGPQRNGVLQIVDREKLLSGNPEPTTENLVYPQLGRLDIYRGWGVHTAFPMLDMEIPDFRKFGRGRVHDFVIAVSEIAGDYCEEFPHLVLFVDITVPDKPTPVSNYMVPESEGDFCERGGRFGPHSSNESFTPIYYKKIVFIAYFNAGVRAVDVRNPFRPEEIAYYIPSTTANTTPSCIAIEGKRQCKRAIQTNNVEVDDRGFIYIVDRAETGMHILELTGSARAIANFP